TMDKLNIQGNYSNNSSTITYLLNPQLDSLNAVVATKDLGLNINYTLPFKGEHQHTIALSGNMQNVSDNIEKSSQSNSSKLFLANIQYMIKTKRKWSMSARVNYNKNEIQGIELNRIGYGAGVKKDFFSNKLSLSVNANFYKNKNANGTKSSNAIGQMMIGYKIVKAMNLQFSINRLSNKSSGKNDFVEYIGNMGIQYSFNYSPKSGKDKK
ncbi:MAG: outer membrane beta-barrel family protein, partial [Bacteroidota bacterium]|nr:outer membrane beta-barrel family protein [Bacteroidota bacterium]